MNIGNGNDNDKSSDNGKDKYQDKGKDTDTTEENTFRYNSRKLGFGL